MCILHTKMAPRGCNQQLELIYTDCLHADLVGPSNPCKQNTCFSNCGYALIVTYSLALGKSILFLKFVF